MASRFTAPVGDSKDIKRTRLTGKPSSGASAITTDGGRLDIAANGFSGSRFEKMYFDVECLIHMPPSNRMSSLSACSHLYRKHENIKKRAYEQRVQEVEHSSFTPIVLSFTGGLGNAATTCYKRLASLLSVKHDHGNNTTQP